jgi:hypothetical protein
LRDIGAIERAGQASWYVIDPLMRRHLATRRVAPLTSVRTAHDTLSITDAASASVIRRRP